MSDSAGGGEGGGAVGAVQDAEADNEPPQQVKPLPQHDSSEVEETSEEGAPPSAKRSRIGEKDQELEHIDESVEMREDTPAQSRVSADLVIKVKKKGKRL